MTIVEKFSPTVVEVLGVRAARFLGFLKPCLPVRSMSELSSLGYDEAAQLANSFSVHLMDAAVCIEDHVFSSTRNSTCPRCGTAVWSHLTDLKVYPVNPSELWDEEKRLRRDSASS